MSDIVLVEKESVATEQPNRGRRIERDDYPKLGQWYWVMGKIESHRLNKKPKVVELLYCVTHIGSNFVRFENDDYQEEVHNKNLLKQVVRQEFEWKKIIEVQIEEKKKELQAAIMALADKCDTMGLLPSSVTAPQSSMLPALTRRDPLEHKKALIKFKEHGYPEMKRGVDKITEKLSKLHHLLIMPEKTTMEKLKGSIDSVEERLFALEMYAGLREQVKKIRSGKPAEENTPITVRQMLRYMDEECLIDYDGGGMDFTKLEDFDEWLSERDNMNRLIPEPRCLVAFKIRRHEKDYGIANSIGMALRHAEWHQANEWTYLAIRNGEQLYRLGSDVEFSPRLLPFRQEFHKPLEKEICRHWNSKKGDYDYGEPETVTPDDLEFDKYASARKKEMTHYNRVMFLLQGLLDRSDVFRPHPMINLSDQDQVSKWLRLVYDEELGLPSHKPPKWETYRDLINAKLTVGKFVYTDEPVEKFGGYCRDDHRPKHGYNANKRPYFCEVTRITRDRKKVRVSWDWGTRHGYEHHNRYGRWGEWPVNRKCHQWIATEKVFNVCDYEPGEFKVFLCDAYLKGAYLEWAPELLSAERWHKERSKQK